jgi:D-alanine-D-alanine ligase
MSQQPVVLLYGIDKRSQRFEIESTLHLVHEAVCALSERGWRVIPQQISDDLRAPLKHYSPAEFVILNLCEGSPAQPSYYANVTQVLGEEGYTFTGSDSWSLDETQYKWRMKMLLERARVPTPHWILREDDSDFHFDAFPAIVKPAAEHCSYGITRDSVVLNLAEARAQVAHCIKSFGTAMVEEFLDSAEYNVSVWGSEQHSAGLEVLGISTMTYDYFGDIHDRLCTFEAKWDPASEAYQKIPAICPAPLNARLRRKIEDVALAAYRASNCRDYGRVDIRLRKDKDGVPAHPMVLDVNSNCDVSSEGGFMNAARAKHLTYGQMLERLIELAQARGPNNRLATPLLVPERVSKTLETVS